jgi:exonuclease SbcD
MRILFSADWHLGYVLMGANQQPRLPDQRRNLALISRYIEEHDVDVVAVAGDVFEAQERGRAREAAEALSQALAPGLARGMRFIAIAGNHDRDWFFETANVWLGAGTAGGGRIILRTRPELLTLDARDERVNFALMPFPTPSRYDVKDDADGGVAHKHERTARRFIEVAEVLRKQAAAQRLPTVLLTHVTVEGTTVQAHRISPRDDIVVPRGGFPDFELTVVGHIHKPERIGSAQFYYVGALDRMDVGEKEYEPRVLLADIGADGVRDVTSLPLDPTPFAHVIARDEEEMTAARALLARPDETLVKLTLALPYGTYSGELLEGARELFPRLYGNVEHVWADAPETKPSVEGLNPADVLGTVRRYLEEQQMPDGERDALMALVGELRAAGVDE